MPAEDPRIEEKLSETGSPKQCSMPLESVTVVRSVNQQVRCIGNAR